jgi:hypothetical protein
MGYLNKSIKNFFLHFPFKFQKTRSIHYQPLPLHSYISIIKNGKSIQVRNQDCASRRCRQGKRREEGEEVFQGRPCREFTFSLRVVHLGSRLTCSQEKKSKKVVKEPTPESSSSEEESDSDEEDSDSDSDAVPTTDIPAPVVCLAHLSW